MLHAYSRDARAKVIELAQAMQHLHAHLASSALGASLEPLYPEVAPPLRGRVELVYDAAHQPSVRYLEALLYRSPYHDVAAQALELSESGAVERAFIFSTPRLPSDAGLRLSLPFRSDKVDTLFGYAKSLTASVSLSNACASTEDRPKLSAACAPIGRPTEGGATMLTVCASGLGAHLRSHRITRHYRAHRPAHQLRRRAPRPSAP